MLGRIALATPLEKDTASHLSSEESVLLTGVVGIVSKQIAEMTLVIEECSVGLFQNRVLFIPPIYCTESVLRLVIAHGATGIFVQEQPEPFLLRITKEHGMVLFDGRELIMEKGFSEAPLGETGVGEFSVTDFPVEVVAGPADGYSKVSWRSLNETV